MKKLFGLLKWTDDHLIPILVGIFIFLIPLYPKLPLHMINYTYIALRVEDIYTAVLILIFLIQLLRKKVQFKSQFFILFSLFWLVVFASYFWGYYVAHTIRINHLGFLNSLRRVEYMSIFFIAAAVIRNKRDFFVYMGLVLFGLLIVGIYGLGQKFIGWPAVQTMNPEYAKGYILFLTPEARISSTFAGHYDLAAYMVFLMPVVWGFYFAKKNIYYIALFVLSLLILVFTASRISFGAYVLSTFPFLLFFRKPKFLALALIFTLLFTYTSKDLSSRFKRTFQVKQIFVDQNTGNVVVPQKITTQELPAGSLYVALKNQTNQTVTQNQEDLLKQNLREQIKDGEKNTGKKLTREEEDALIASLSARLKPVNTVVSDISFATRLQVEWPRAIFAFLKNPVLGTGPSSITEATDNDYLRSLGETGILGSMLFAIIILLIGKSILVSANKIKNDDKYIYYGFLFGLFALLINAGYIDVFEASKIGFQFWLIAGFFIGSLIYEKRNV